MGVIYGYCRLYHWCILKIITMDQQKTFRLADANQFSKAFYRGEGEDKIEMYVIKAYDETEKMNYCVVGIPAVNHLRVYRLRMPYGFEREEDRDFWFMNFDPDKIFAEIEAQVIENKKNNR